MNWTRSNSFRGLVVVLLAAYVVAQVIQRDWLWVGIGTTLLLLNLSSWRLQASSPTPLRANPPQPSDTPLVPDGVDLTLSELLDRPEVLQAWSTGPAVWRQVSYLEDEDDLALSADEVAEYAWITTSEVGGDDEVSEGEPHWSISVGDELKPLLDLDVPEDEDPLVATVARHPAVAEVEHSDREEYRVVLRAPLTLTQMSVLAAEGLIAHHLDAVRRHLGPDSA